MSRRCLQVVPLLLLPCLLLAGAHAQTTVASSAPASAVASPSSAADRVVLKVGDVQLTQAQFELLVSTLEAQQGPADLSRQAIGENYASILMMAQQAVAHHLDTSPEVLRQLAMDRNQILSNAEFASLKAQAEPTPEEISAYYNAHLDDYDVVQVRRLFVWMKKSDGTQTMTSAEAHALGDAVRQAYATGSDPRKLIHDPNSVVLDSDPLAFRRGELPEKMEKAAFTMKEGEWVVLDDNPTTLVVMQLVKRSPLELKEVSPAIEKKLQGQKLQAELSNLKKQTGIWMDPEYFATTAPKPASSAPSQASGPNK